MVAKKKPRYIAQPYAVVHCLELSGKEVTAKFYKREVGGQWADIYVGRKKVWHCNRDFFNAHFTKLKQSGRSTNSAGDSLKEFNKWEADNHPKETDTDALKQKLVNSGKGV